MEARLREGLRLLAEEAPELGAARPRRGRGGLLVAAVLVIALGVGGYVAMRPQQSSPGSASCAAILRYDGRGYDGYGEPARMPEPGDRIGTGILPGCDDSGGQDPVEPPKEVDVYRYPGIDAEVAVITRNGVWLAIGAAAPKEWLTQGRRILCDFTGTRTVVGSWLGVRSKKPVRFDGDIRLPFTFTFQTSDPRLADDYAHVTFRVRAADDLVPPTVAVVDRLLWQGEDAEVVLRCDGDAFLADVLRPAR